MHVGCGVKISTSRTYLGPLCPVPASDTSTMHSPIIKLRNETRASDDALRMGLGLSSNLSKDIRGFMLTGELRKQIDLIGVLAERRSPDAIEAESLDTRASQAMYVYQSNGSGTSL